MEGFKKGSFACGVSAVNNPRLIKADEDVIGLGVVGRRHDHYVLVMTSCSPVRGRAPPLPPLRRMAGAVLIAALALSSH
jgi:hypothetical protein